MRGTKRKTLSSTTRNKWTETKPAREHGAAKTTRIAPQGLHREDGTSQIAQFFFSLQKKKKKKNFFLKKQKKKEKKKKKEQKHKPQTTTKPHKTTK